MKPPLLILIILIGFISCSKKPIMSLEERKQHELDFVSTMQKHMDAVTNKDLETLASTLPPHGEMQLILEGQEIIESVDGFMDFHKEWFALPNWTFETEIKKSVIGDKMGLSLVEIVYREPERDGKPYFNRMMVSYDLQLIEGKWYIIKDHASSIEKSTD